MINSPDFLFVYGTLMNAFKMHKPLNISDYGKIIGEGYTYGKLYRISWYPALILDKNAKGKVWGELYEINNLKEIINVLDFYEGYSPNNENESDYRRIKAPVFIRGKEYLAWLYEYVQPISESQIIASGRFLEKQG